MNDFTQIHSSKQFCEDILLDNFYPNNTDVFPNYRIVVAEKNDRNCMLGIDDDEIVTEVGVCFPEPSSALVSSAHTFQTLVIAPLPSEGYLVGVSVLFLLTVLTLQ